MLLGCIADDFTGASDLANTLARGGMSTVQFAGIPADSEVPDCEAGVVALKTRSIPAQEAVRQSLDALAWLREQGCRQYFFKYCSTFDSTPQGNIGPVAEALLAELKAPVAIVCPVFPATGRTLFQGHLFVNGRLLNESGMENHPLNPMTDPDIRRWLARQTSLETGLVPYDVVRAGSPAVAQALTEAAAAGQRLVVVDAVEDNDLKVIGEAIASHALVTGGSGIALGLPENFRRAGLLAQAGSGFEPVAGPGVVLSGSCSTASNAQVAAYLETHPGFTVRAEALMADASALQAEALAFVRSHLAQAPMVYSTAGPEQVRADQKRFGREALAQRIESFFAGLANQLVTRESVRRLVIGGGETAGAIVTALDIRAMRVGPEIDPGVPALTTTSPDPLGLALKSGNFGAPDFYQKAMAVLGGHPA